MTKRVWVICYRRWEGDMWWSLKDCHSRKEAADCIRKHRKEFSEICAIHIPKTVAGAAVAAMNRAKRTD